MQVLKQNSLLKKIGEIADQEKAEVYAVGGFIRDKLLGRECKDIDFVIVGDGPSFARKVAKKMQTKPPTIYQKFGTALVVYKDYNLEFVGARKESYRSNSRKPTVTPADLPTDLARRDFTINALAIGLNKNNFSQIVDPFSGQQDIKKKNIRTPLDPVVTFKDDPLRIMRAIRFATQLDFTIDPETKTGIKKNG